jgi:hypothetical protein
MIAVHPIQTGHVQIKSRQTTPRHERREARVLDLLLDRRWTRRSPGRTDRSDDLRVGAWS